MFVFTVYSHWEDYIQHLNEGKLELFCTNCVFQQRHFFKLWCIFLLVLN